MPREQSDHSDKSKNPNTREGEGDGVHGTVRTILSMSEERMGEVVNQLLANEAFVGAVQRAISGSLEAKRGVDKGLSTMLSMINIPTLEDVDKVRTKLSEVEESMAEIAQRVSALAERAKSGSSEASAGKKAKR